MKLTAMPKKRPATSRQQIVAVLHREIVEGRLGPGRKVAGDFALAERFGVSRGTIRAALDELVRQGLITRTSGRGTFATSEGNGTTRPVVFLLKDVEKIHSQVITHLLQGLVPRVEQAGSHVVFQHRSPAEWPAALRQSLAGVVVIPHGASQADLDELSAARIPFVIATESELAGPAIKLGIEEVSHRLTLGLVELGHRHFALVSGHSRHADLAKKKGIQSALKVAGLDLSTLPELPTNYSPDAGYRAAHELLKLSPRPTAVIAFNDMLAVQVMTVARQQGYQVPADLSIVGLNNAPFSSMTEPAICSADIPYVEAGRCAAEFILAGGAGRPPELKSKVIWRHSAAPPAPQSKRSSARPQKPAA